MPKNGKHLLINLFLLTIVVQLYSQEGPTKELTIASPTAASLGKYADIPVNYHTGQPQISIPLYTVKEGNLSLPIDLSYYAGGLKVMEPAGWTGAGWSLQAGGVITRSVVGGPDEYNTNTSGSETHGYFSHYGYNSYLYDNNKQDWQSIANGYKDGEPDLFFYNFNGMTGKFFFSDDHTPVFLPEKDLKIQYDYSLTDSNSIQSFIITTSDGTKYFFGKTVSTTDIDPVERTLSYTAESGTAYGNIISSWYLNKIESADGQFSVSLSYQEESYGYYTTAMYPIDGNKTGAGYKNTGYMLVKNIMQGVRLNQISFSNGSINFNAGSVRTDLADNGSNFYDGVNTSAATLGSIQINGTGGLCKKFVFSYNYFSDNTTSLAGDYALMSYNIQTDRKRLRLESVQESTCTGETISPYQFVYFTEKVPRMLSFGIDHWGFYNGASNQGLIPTYVKDNVSVSGANRDASWPAMRGGALQKIIYPTGGYTIFDFEPHNFKTSTTSYNPTYIAGLIVHQGGQSQLTHSVPFTVTNTGNNVNNCKFTVNNNSPNWSPTFSIKNNSNVEQAGGPWLVSVSSSFSQTITLPPGDYVATLSYPSNSGSTLTNGADAKIEQWKYETTQSIATIGGLRIKSITNNDGITSNDVVTSFDYTAGGGPPTLILYGRPTYVQQIRNDLIRDVGYWTTSGFTPYAANSNGCPTGGGMFYKSAGSLRPMGSTQGSHVGYFEVRKKQAGQGYSIYRYDGTAAWNQSTDDVANRVINTTICDANIPNYPSAPLPFDPQRGELKYVGHFNEAGQMLQEKNYLSFYENSAVSTPGFIVHARQFGSAVELLGTFYTLKSAKKVKEEIIETVNTPGVGNITTTNITYFESAFHNEPTRKTSIGSKSEMLETRLKYAFDYRISNCESVSSCLAELTSALAACQNNYNTARAACNGSSSCLTTTYLDYLSCQNQVRINYINCRKNNFTNTTNSFKTCHDNARSSANAELKPILELQDDYNNALIETSQWKNGSLLSAGFTRFDYGLNPATKVYPGKTQSIRVFSPSSSFDHSSVSSTNTSIGKDVRYTDELLYKFDKGNLVEQTKHNDVTTVYLWGYQNKYPVAKITGTTYAAAQAIITQSILDNPASDAALMAELNKLRTNLTSAQVTTYAYNPLKGITTETDAAGNTIYYEYDGFGRLQLIRDQNQNIVKRICYNYQGQEENCKVYYNVAKNGTFTRSCSAGYTGSQVTYTVAAGAYASGSSQADADQKAQDDVNNNGQTFANANGSCLLLYYNVAKSGTYTRSCGSGYVGSQVTYNVVAGTHSSTVSQADADQKAQDDVNNNGQAYANANGTCTATYYNVAKSGTYTRSCSSGYVGSQVTYNVAAGTHSSTVSQADADQKAQDDVNNNGQAYANTNGTCKQTWYNVEKSGSYTRNNCGSGTTPTTVTYTVAAGSYSSLVSQADADQKAQDDVNANGQNYANNNAICQQTWYNTEKSGSYTRNNCGSGTTPTTVTYTVAAGSYSSLVSQAEADQKAQDDVNTNGQNYANNNAICQPTWYNVAKSKSFTRNNCSYPYTGGNVSYTVAAGTYSSLISQADADGKAQNDINTNGQAYANSKGTCDCTGKGTKLVKGKCQMGTKVYTSSQYKNGAYQCKYYYQWSDGSTSGEYLETNSKPCPIQ